MAFPHSSDLPTTAEGSGVCRVYVQSLVVKYYKWRDVAISERSGSRYPWLQKFTRVFIRAGFEHFLTFDAKPQQYEDWVSNAPQNHALALQR